MAGCFGRTHNLSQPTTKNIENCMHNLKLKGLQKETHTTMKRRLYTLSKQCDINIEQALFLQETDEWTTMVTHDINEETKAINAGFQLVRAINETTAIYKKRK